MKKKLNIITILSIFNVILLSYTGWIKYSYTGCTSCNQVFFLPINSVGVALLGVATSLLLAIFSYLYTNSNTLQYTTLIISASCSCVASFLQIAQFLWKKDICYYCLASTMIFYIIFIIMLYKNVIKSIWSKLISDMA